jgi:radical SAM protein with 4Fe4S-binding SPASM domain
MKNLKDQEVINLNTKTNDPLIERKKINNSKVTRFKNIPLPAIIEISASGTCNRVCSFCPRSAPDYEDIKQFISKELINKLSLELANIQYEGLVLFSGFIEPLLDKRLPEHILKIKKNNPYCRIEVVTNGDPITVSNLKKLDKAGLDQLLVSCYDGPEQIENISSKQREAGIDREFIQYRKRWSGPDANFGISLSNRGGLMKNAIFKIPNLTKAWNNPCYYPAYTFFLDYTGDVLMCAHDWGKKAIVGDFNNQSLLEIWTGEKFSRLRNKLISGDRRLKPCNVCNVEGTRMGLDHVYAWVNS